MPRQPAAALPIRTLVVDSNGFAASRRDGVLGDSSNVPTRSSRNGTISE